MGLGNEALAVDRAHWYALAVLSTLVAARA
jgi:hypothetical protein